MRVLARPNDWDDARIDSWIRIALVVAAMAPFIGTLFYGFVYDDTVILLHNRTLDGWKSILEVWKHPYWDDGGPERHGLYRPLLMMCFAIVSNAAHRYAIALHLFAVALHVVATLLVAKLLRRGVGRWPATAAALWFAVHPVHVEAVAEISNSSETLVCIWTITMVLWLWPAAEDAAIGWKRAIVAAMLYAAALLTKESGGVAPGLAIVAALAWRPAAQLNLKFDTGKLRAWARPIAMWIVVLAGVIVLRRVVLGGVTGTVSLAVPGLDAMTGPQRVWAMLSTGGDIARLLVWPTTQSPDYGPTALTDGTMRNLLAVCTLLVIALALLWSSRLAWRAHERDARPLAAVLWCLLAYLPASNLFGATGPVIGERTLYTTSAGVAMLIAWCLERLLVHAAQSRRELARRVLVGAAAIALVAACVRGYRRSVDYAGVWRDHQSLFWQMVRADSLYYRGYELLAMDAQSHNRLAEAQHLYLRAYTMRPFDPTVLTAYGEFLLQVHRPRHALAMARRLLRDRRERSDARAVALYMNAAAAVRGADSAAAR